MPLSPKKNGGARGEPDSPRRSTPKCSIAYYLRYDLFCRQSRKTCETGLGSRGKPRPPSWATGKAENTVKIPGSRWTAERSPECASLPLLCRTSTSLGAGGWPTGCLVLSSVRGLQMNVCRINGAQHLVERSHECPRRSDQTISMHTRRPYRVWMGLSPSIELNNANGKSVHMPRRIAQSSNG